MDRYYQADAVNSVPDLTKLVSAGYPTNGDPELGIPATQPGEGWFYAITEELVNVIIGAGLTPDKTDVTQLVIAINTIVNSLVNSAMPTGVVLPFGGGTVPTGWLLANGAAVSRTTFANLFSVYGTTHGAGDGTTTFNIPDARDRYIIGVDTNGLGVKIAEQLPNIRGQVYAFGMGIFNNASGVFSSATPANASGYSQATQADTKLIFNASNSNSTYTDSGKVYPLSLALNFIIKC